MTCLFIGNLIKHINEPKLIAIFKQYGICNVDIKGPYAFVEYENEKDAVLALKDLNKTTIKGANGPARVRIEFSKKKKGNGKLEENDHTHLDENFSEHSEKTHSNININDDDHKRKNVCFICKLPGHFAKECILTKDSCYECGEKGHIAKECQAGIREACLFTENRAKAIASQQSSFRYLTSGQRIKNIVNYFNKKAEIN